MVQIDIDCTPEELVALLAELPDPAQRYEILRKAIKPKLMPAVPSERVVLRPESPKTESVAVIRLNGSILSAFLEEKHDGFRQIVKFQCSMEFNWGNRQWYRRMDKFTGNPLDRTIELCHRLLAGGFIIEVDTTWVTAIHAADYQPEQTRWIKRVVDGGEYNDWFSINWGRLDDYYEVAKRLPGSRYNGDTVVVPSVHFDAIIDFAHARDFSLSEGTHELIAIAKAKRDAAILTTVEPPKQRKRVVAVDARPQLQPVTEETIADEFADDIA